MPLTAKQKDFLRRRIGDAVAEGFGVPNMAEWDSDEFYGREELQDTADGIRRAAEEVLALFEQPVPADGELRRTGITGSDVCSLEDFRKDYPYDYMAEVYRVEARQDGRILPPAPDWCEGLDAVVKHHLAAKDSNAAGPPAWIVAGLAGRELRLYRRDTGELVLAAEFAPATVRELRGLTGAAGAARLDWDAYYPAVPDLHDAVWRRFAKAVEAYEESGAPPGRVSI